MDRAKIIGKVLLSTDFGKASAIISQFRPMLRKPAYVEQIFNAVQEQYADESAETRRLIFISCIYQAYQPLSFLPSLKEEGKDAQAAGKLPAGIRDKVSSLLGFNNPEMVNHYRTFAEPWMRPFNTGPERPFRTKVMAIIERFKSFSINAEDTQYQLSL